MGGNQVRREGNVLLFGKVEGRMGGEGGEVRWWGGVERGG